MNLVRSLAIAILAVGLAASAAPVFADLYDTPTASITQVSRSSVRVQVRAGATGAPAGFAVDWMYKSDYDAAGGWDGGWAAGTLYWCTFTGTPTWNHLPGVNTYALAPFQAQVVELGDVFDETGMAADYWLELQPAREVVVRAYVLGDANGEDSYYTATLLSTTLPDPDNCTYTQGYWKTHFGDWPVFATMMLGTVNYTPAQLLSILNTPAAGNGLIILAHQLITVKLNILSGADPSLILGDIAAADAMIGGLVIPPVGAGYLPPGTTSALTTTLDNWNNGITGPGHCNPTPTQSSSWGRVKSLYR